MSTEKSEMKKIELNFEDDLYIFSDDIYEQIKPEQKYGHGGEYEGYERINSHTFFPGSDKPFNIEIGIGNGEFISEYGKKYPEQNFLGFEVMKRIFRRAIIKASQVENKNVRLIHYDATVFVSLLEDGSVDNFYVNFPDPWPKKRHRKRRLLKTRFIELLVSKLKLGGSLFMATDQEDYASEIVENLQPVKNLSSFFETTYINEIVDYQPTKYYRKFAEEGEVFFFRMVKKEV